MRISPAASERYLRKGFGGLYACKVPDLFPEMIDIGDRPLIQLSIVFESHTVLGLDCFLEGKNAS